MFKIALCLNKYTFQNKIDNVRRDIVWIPINKKRNFKYDKISKTNIKKTQDNFEAFVASGVTFGLNPRITIVTRYEEVEKLLIHELIHNYNLDGSGFHDNNHSLIKKYSKIKNSHTMSNIKNYDYPYSLYESYTELLSSYLSMIFRNWDLTEKKRNNS